MSIFHHRPLFPIGEYDKAIVDHNKALDLNPKFAEAYYKRGLALFRKGQYDKAISDYNKAIEINPIIAGAYVARGAVYQITGEYDKACSDLKNACNLGNCQGLEFAKSKGYCK